ncbi:hypothetical protein ILUMI_02739 [Ignelater luminosus]|uniref:Uncharacterized protein n=1 Tax=Ignelater luminosus TaxID=2038154 RepID=A0A8K0GJ02_IGNLU|nr:hypothetical protein ILUMI_02739 [Ignelater luminosus]
MISDVPAEIEILKFPCHLKTVERCVKLVTEASASVIEVQEMGSLEIELLRGQVYQNSKQKSNILKWWKTKMMGVSDFGVGRDVGRCQVFIECASIAHDGLSNVNFNVAEEETKAGSLGLSTSTGSASSVGCAVDILQRFIIIYQH